LFLFGLVLEIPLGRTSMCLWRILKLAHIGVHLIYVHRADYGTAQKVWHKAKHGIRQNMALPKKHACPHRLSVESGIEPGFHSLWKDSHACAPSSFAVVIRATRSSPLQSPVQAHGRLDLAAHLGTTTALVWQTCRCFCTKLTGPTHFSGRASCRGQRPGRRG